MFVVRDYCIYSGNPWKMKQQLKCKHYKVANSIYGHDHGSKWRILSNVLARVGKTSEMMANWNSILQNSGMFFYVVRMQHFVAKPRIDSWILSQ